MLRNILTVELYDPWNRHGKRELTQITPRSVPLRVWAEMKSTIATRCTRRLFNPPRRRLVRHRQGQQAGFIVELDASYLESAAPYSAYSACIATTAISHSMPAVSALAAPLPVSSSFFVDAASDADWSCHGSRPDAR